MRFYYSLQYKRFYRILQGLGLEPVLIIPVCLFLFYWISSSFFESILYAGHWYSALTVMVAAVIGFSKHNEFIRAHCSIYLYRMIVFSNQLLLVFPFLVFLVYKGFYLHSLGVFIVAMLFSFFKKLTGFRFVIPTPFYRKPYEFVVGFRNTFWAFLISYTLAIISVCVGNFNLGMFSILSVFFICSGYYMKPDPEFYTWIHAMTPKEFLIHKIIIGIKYSVLLTLPSIVLLAVFYFDKLYIALFFEILGAIYIALHVLVRYSFARGGGTFFQAITGVLSVFFPPIMIIFLPYFYSKAIQNLNSILDDSN